MHKAVKLTYLGDNLLNEEFFIAYALEQLLKFVLAPLIIDGGLLLRHLGLVPLVAALRAPQREFHCHLAHVRRQTDSLANTTIKVMHLGDVDSGFVFRPCRHYALFSAVGSIHLKL